VLESLTPIRDLGVLEGPVLVFGGPYGNLEATDAMLAAARRLCIDGDNAVCTGDLVAYAADPQAVVDRIRAWGCAVVMGNCEESLAADAEDCGCGFNAGSACAALSAQWFTATRRDLDAETKRWMGTLPRRVDFALAGRRFAAIHGGLARINQFIFASAPAAQKRAQIETAGAGAILAGHCGIPFSQGLDGKLWHNSGALGMPANDGTPRVWFSVLTPQDNGIAVEFHAVTYDHEAAAAKMRARRYPAEYADALGTGLWPSCDILPAAESAARGAALAPETLFWPHETTRARRLDISPQAAV
jgi:diadenosine tetraphosphatase ApaH/serine/threonine PP2A family protein phosphatase